jgi:hypothetical protein
MGGRVAGRLGFALALLLSTGSLGEAKPSALPVIPFPSVGNLTVGRLIIKSTATSGVARAPRLTLASRSGIPADAFVVATVGRASAARFIATVAIVRPSAVNSPARASGPAKFLTLRLPPGFSLAGPPQVARDVLYINRTPSFGLAASGVGSVLVGKSPPKLPIAQLVKDAQLLAFDRSVPLADMALLGLPYVAAQFPRTSTTTQRVTIALSRLSQVNAVELRFPSGMTVSKVAGPPGTDGILLGKAVQLIGSSGFFQEGVAYSFTLELSRAPKKGDFVTLRASTHYFESSLPFTERFALS